MGFTNGLSRPLLAKKNESVTLIAHMRYVPLSGELRNIRRVDYVKETGKGKTALWQVHFTFKNRSPISQSFSDKTHGGKDAALVAAQRFRNALEQEFAAADLF